MLDYLKGFGKYIMLFLKYLKGWIGFLLTLGPLKKFWLSVGKWGKRILIFIVACILGFILMWFFARDTVERYTGITEFNLLTNDYSVGAKMGYLSKLSIHRTGHGECRVFIGVQSTQYTDPSGKVKNPWEFTIDSSNKKLLEKAWNLRKKTVLVVYEQKKLNLSLRKTSYVVVDIIPVTGLAPEEVSYTTDMYRNIFDKNFIIDRSHGFMSGRFVERRIKGSAVKTREIGFQEGPSGNFFQNFTVLDTELYDYIQLCMESGLLYTVYYVDQGAAKLTASDSRYVIVKVVLDEM